MLTMRLGGQAGAPLSGAQRLPGGRRAAQPPPKLRRTPAAARVWRLGASAVRAWCVRRSAGPQPLLRGGGGSPVAASLVVGSWPPARLASASRSLLLPAISIPPLPSFLPRLLPPPPRRASIPAAGLIRFRSGLPPDFLPLQTATAIRSPRRLLNVHCPPSRTCPLLIPLPFHTSKPPPSSISSPLPRTTPTAALLGRGIGRIGGGISLSLSLSTAFRVLGSAARRRV